MSTMSEAAVTAFNRYALSKVVRDVHPMRADRFIFDWPKEAPYSRIEPETGESTPAVYLIVEFEVECRWEKFDGHIYLFARHGAGLRSQVGRLRIRESQVQEAEFTFPPAAETSIIQSLEAALSFF